MRQVCWVLDKPGFRRASQPLVVLTLISGGGTLKMHQTTGRTINFLSHEFEKQHGVLLSHI